MRAIEARDGGFVDFVRDRSPALLRLAYLICGDRFLAEDAVQDALLKARRRWDRIATADHPDAYVRRIVVNQCLSWRRNRSSREVPATIAEGTEPDVSAGMAERDLVWRAIGTLPRRQRIVLALRYYEDLPDDEIAAYLDVAQSTVRSLAARALATLRNNMDLAAGQRR